MRTSQLRNTTLAVLLAAVSILSSCGGASSQPDSDQMATQVAQQVQATLTAGAQAVPTATPTAKPSATPTELPPTATSTPTPSPTPTQTRPPTSTPTKRPPTSTPTQTYTPTPPPSVGDIVRCADLWEVGVNARPSFAKRLNVIDTQGYMTITDAAVAKGEWMLLYFTLTNLQSETSSLSYFGDDLVAQGKLGDQWVSFAPSSWGTSRSQRSAGISDWNDDIPPGITVTAVAIFDVNPACEQWTLVIQPEKGSEKVCEARIRLDQVSSGRAMATVTKQVNLRTGPGGNYAVLAVAKVGLTFEITGRNKDASWWQVRYQSKKAWLPASTVTASGPTDSIAEITNIAPPPSPKPPAATATPLPKVKPEQEFVVQIWGLRLYDVKRAKVVYWFGNAEIAHGTYLIPFLEFRNAGSGTAYPSHNLDFYLQDDRGRQYEFDTFGDAVLGAAWQFHAGHLYDDINPGLKLGIALPFDVPPEMGDVWLRVEQDPKLAIYLGNVSQLPESK